MMDKHNDFLLFSDIVQFFSDVKYKVLYGMVACAFLGALFIFGRPVHYEVHSSFKDIGHGSSIAKTIFGTHNVPDGEYHGLVTMKSRRILSEVVRKVGLQIHFDRKRSLSGLFRQIQEVLFAEMGKKLPAVSRLNFSDVDYDGETSLTYSLVFKTPTAFECYDAKQQLIGCGQVGHRFTSSLLSFTLNSGVGDLQLFSPYPLHIDSFEKSLKGLSQSLKLCAHNYDSQLIDIYYRHRDRVFGEHVVSTLMTVYSTFLRDEHAALADQQVAYLEHRKGQLCDQISTYLGQHAEHLKASVNETGFFYLSDRLKELNERQTKYSDELMKCDLEEAQVTNAHGCFNSRHPLFTPLIALQEDLNAKKKRRDVLNLGLSESSIAQTCPMGLKQKLEKVSYQEKRLEANPQVIALLLPQIANNLETALKRRERAHQESFIHTLSPIGSELSEVRKERQAYQNLLSQFDSADSMGSKMSLASDFCGTESVEDALAVIQNHIKRLSIREHICHERLLCPSKSKQEFCGIDLATADQMYLEYVKAKDEYGAKVLQLEFALAEIDRTDVESISLGNILPDPTSQEISRNLGYLSQTMRDLDNFSEKDFERMKRKKGRLQVDLKRHIKETIDLYNLQMNLIAEKMHYLNGLRLDLLNQDIAVIKSEMSRRLEENLGQLRSEKAVIENAMDRVKAEMSVLPEHWLKEYQLTFSANMNMNMLDSMARLVESKNVEYHMTPIKSKPLDVAYAAVIPQSPFLTLSTLLAAFVGGVLTFLYFFVTKIVRGFPVTLKNLKVRGLDVFGSLSEGVIQVVRAIAHTMDEKDRVVSVITPGEKELVDTLATSLAKEGKKVVVFDFDFSLGTIEAKLLTYLDQGGSMPQPESKGDYDLIPAGGMNTFKAELLKHPRFLKLLDKQKEKYDVVLLSSPLGMTEAESKVLTLFSDAMVVAFKRASISELQPYIDWEEADSTRLLGFVTS